MPKVGVGVMIVRDGKVLLGLRQGSHGANTYSFPGGHLENLESFESCAKRETLEECGVEIDNVNFLFLANLVAYAPKHYAHVGLVAEWKNGEPQLLEPSKFDSWGWYDLENLPQPLFEACKMSIEAYKTGKNYFDSK